MYSRKYRLRIILSYSHRGRLVLFLRTVYYEESAKQVKVAHAPIKIFATHNNVSHAGIDPQSFLLTGDSGGGRFVNGKLVGNHFGDVGIGGSPYDLFSSSSFFCGWFSNQSKKWQ